MVVVSGYGDADRLAEDKTAELALIRVHGAARNNFPAALIDDGAKGADLTVVGIADPQTRAAAAPSRPSPRGSRENSSSPRHSSASSGRRPCSMRKANSAWPSSRHRSNTAMALRVYSFSVLFALLPKGSTKEPAQTAECSVRWVWVVAVVGCGRINFDVPHSVLENCTLVGYPGVPWPTLDTDAASDLAIANLDKISRPEAS